MLNCTTTRENKLMTSYILTPHNFHNLNILCNKPTICMHFLLHCCVLNKKCPGGCTDLFPGCTEWLSGTEGVNGSHFGPDTLCCEGRPRTAGRWAAPQGSTHQMPVVSSSPAVTTKNVSRHSLVGKITPTWE